MSDDNVMRLFGPSRNSGSLPSQYERVQQWQTKRYDLITAAVAAGAWSYSHRQETHDRHPAGMGRYASAVLACREGDTPDTQFGIFSGWNFKLRRGDGRSIQYHPLQGYKLCSEPDAIVAAVGIGYYAIHGLVLFSDNMQKEDVSKLFTNIQHPCYDCREFLAKFLRPDSPIIVVRHRLLCDVFAGPRTEFIGDLVAEDWTYREICELHKHAQLTGRR